MKKLAFLILVLMLSTSNSFASHIISTEISYTYVSGNDYEITLTIYRDCSGVSATTQEFVSIQSDICGDTILLALPRINTINASQACASQTTTCNGGTIPGADKIIYRAIVTLTPCSDWVMTWTQCCKNNGITNLTNLGFNTYIETKLNNIAGANNNSPSFQNTALPYFNTNSSASYNHGAIETDGDSIYFSKIAPLEYAATNYTFVTGYSVNDQIITSSGFNLNPTTGDMTFTPSINQICVVTTLIEEFRNGVLIGSQIREIQVTASAQTNQPPTNGTSGGITINYGGPSADSLNMNTVSLCPTDTICIETTFSDPDGDNIFISSNVPTTIPGATWSITNNNTPNPIGRLCWRPTAQDVGLNIFNLTIEDDACPIKGIQSYSFIINVNGKPYAGKDTTVCLNEPLQLQASGSDNNYTWFDVSTNTQIPVGPTFSCNPCANPIITPPTGPNSYYVLSSQSTICENTDTVVITVNPNTVIPPVLNDTNFCEGLSTSIDAGNSYTTYEWIPSGGNSQIGVFDTVASYAVIVSDGVCKSTSNFASVIEIATPHPTILGADSTCLNSSSSFTFDPIYNNPLWSVGPNTFNTNTITLLTAGAFNLSLTADSLGCTGSTNIVVLPSPSPIVTLAPFNTTSLCQNGSTITLPIGNPTGGIYSGAGVSGNTFDPSLANIGNNDIVYTYTSANSCKGIDTSSIDVDACTDINEILSSSEIIIYPNPSNGIFTIERPVNTIEKAHIKILDVNSKLILETIIEKESQNTSIDISKYNSGIYFIKLIIKDQLSVKRILKE